MLKSGRASTSTSSFLSDGRDDRARERVLRSFWVGSPKARASAEPISLDEVRARRRRTA
jgi:hypothetical protein